MEAVLSGIRDGGLRRKSAVVGRFEAHDGAWRPAIVTDADGLTAVGV